MRLRSSLKPMRVIPPVLKSLAKARLIRHVDYRLSCSRKTPRPLKRRQRLPHTLARGSQRKVSHLGGNEKRADAARPRRPLPARQEHAQRIDGYVIEAHLEVEVGTGAVAGRATE